MHHVNEHFPDMELLSLSGNYCTDKKQAAVNWYLIISQILCPYTCIYKFDYHALSLYCIFIIVVGILYTHHCCGRLIFVDLGHHFPRIYIPTSKHKSYLGNAMFKEIMEVYMTSCAHNYIAFWSLMNKDLLQ